MACHFEEFELFIIITIFIIVFVSIRNILISVIIISLGVQATSWVPTLAAHTLALVCVFSLDRENTYGDQWGSPFTGTSPWKPWAGAEFYNIRI